MRGRRLDAVLLRLDDAAVSREAERGDRRRVLDAGATCARPTSRDSLRAGTSALLAALDAIAGGRPAALVCAADCRMGEPDSPAEQNYGDAGAAVLLGDAER